MCKNMETVYDFIRVAEQHGMPVRMLRDVAHDRSFWQYDIVFLAGHGVPHTKTFDNIVILYESDLYGLQHSVSRRDDPEAVTTLYHECTHAYMDKWDHDDSSMFKGAVAWYEGQKLTNGQTVDDPERVAQEAAAAYVGHRAVTMWATWNLMAFLAEVLDNVDSKKTTADRGRTIVDGLLAKGTVPERYDREMRNEVFGYQEVDDRHVSVASRPIESGLRAYCDGLILEDKIKWTFDRMPMFRPGYERLQKRIAGLRGR